MMDVRIACEEFSIASVLHYDVASIKMALDEFQFRFIMRYPIGEPREKCNFHTQIIS